MPDEFRFLRPEWLWLIPVVLAAVLVFVCRRLAPGSWQHLVDPALAPHVLSVSRSAAGRDFRGLLLGVVGVAGSLALAGPAWERIEQPVFRSDQALVVALDLSRSMDAQDVKPSRLRRARRQILDLLERRAGGPTALVVYSANAFTVTPLTSDTDTITALVNSLSTDIMPSRGSYPPAAIDRGLQLLEQAGVPAGEVLLVTDGGTSPTAQRHARELRAAGFTLSVLGVGTPEGAPIPRAGGGFVTDQRGRIALPELKESGLRSLASAGGGRYARLTPTNADLDYLLAGETAARASVSGSAEFAERLATDQWREAGPWLVLLLLPLAALAFRKGWVFALAGVWLVGLPPSAAASVWDDLWYTPDQQGLKALDDGDAAAASQRFEDSEWSAVASYRAGDYGRSAALFADGSDARSLYNLGNSLARLGEFDSAIEAYEQVLEMQPDHEDAAHNLELLRQSLAQQAEDSQQQSSQQDSGGSSQSQENPEQQGMDAQNQSASQSDAAEPAVGDDEAMSDEELEAMERALEEAAREAQQKASGEPDQPSPELSEEQLAARRDRQAQEQAMEQWLRRIPNDPGGLLRRKFRYQYQRSGKDQDGNNLWPDDEVQPW